MTVWRKSSYSTAYGNNCVEVAEFADEVGVRDSKDRGGPVLLVDTAAWRLFLAAAKRGGFDR